MPQLAGLMIGNKERYLGLFSFSRAKHKRTSGDELRQEKDGGKRFPQ